MISPLSSAPPTKIRDLSRVFIRERLTAYYQVEPPVDAVLDGYAMWRCSETGLEFAWPMLPGNAVFYEWVSGFPGYYPASRWEYGEVRRALGSLEPAAKQVAQVLDVGCGEGKFLASLDFIAKDRRYGLDFNQPGIEACRRKGFQAFQGTIDAALAANFIGPAQFAVVTSFHCLEHVDRPVEFVRSLAAVTAPGGRIFLSTPYSPMSFEGGWFDILNHPPHHLTRWNVKSYERLAGILGLEMRCSFQPSGALRQALTMFRLIRYGPYRRVSGTKLMADLLIRFPVALRSYYAQLQRARRNGGVMGDVILVELRRR